MSFSYWPKVAALALLPAAAIAQQVQQAGPTDANAPVPASSYVSAFENYRTATDNQSSPDAVWRAANEEVGRSDPHAGHSATPGMNAQPAALQSNATQPDPHAGHGGHMAMPGMKLEAAIPRAGTSKADPHAGHSGHMAMPGLSAKPAAQTPGSIQSEAHAGHGAHLAAPRANTGPATPKARPSQSDPHAGHTGQHNMQGK